MNSNEVFSEVESHVRETQMQGHHFQQMSLEEAVSYLCQVESTLEKDDPFAYCDFLDLLNDFKSRRIDLPECIRSLKDLFRGHPELIVGFNKSLPPEHRIEVPPTELVQLQEPGTNLGGGGTSLTIHSGGTPTKTLHSTQGSHSRHSPSPSTAGNAVNKVCGNSELEDDFHTLALGTRNPFESSYSS